MAAVRIGGTLRVPGDKSISHRALILAALTSGRSRISRILDSADVRSTAQALVTLGAAIPPLSDDFIVASDGVAALRADDRILDCGNSGTTARLLAGVVAGAGRCATFVGDASLSRRPMRRIAEPLRAMGATVELSEAGGLPMRVSAGALHDLEWTSSVASAQVKSAALLAGLLAQVRIRFVEPHRSRDHTERMLESRAVNLIRSGPAVELPPGQTLRPVGVQVPADPSSAAYFVALALLADHGELHLRDVCLNETRTGFLETLFRMGADISLSDQRIENGEPIGTIIARPSELRGVAIAAEEVPAMIDELPLLACLATAARGDTVVEGAGELRVKESDRIATVVANLESLGAQAEERSDGFRVSGSGRKLRGHVRTRGDHRLAMAFGILGAVRGNRITLDDRECVAISYPGFWTDLRAVMQ